MVRELRCDVVSSELLEQLIHSPLPLGLSSSPPVRSFYREMYLDTHSDTLRKAGIRCSIRVAAEGESNLVVEIGERGRAADSRQRYSARLPDPDIRSALTTPSEPVKRLSAILDPRLIELQVELDVERHTRNTAPDWMRRPSIAAHFERIKVRAGGSAKSFHQLTLEQVRGNGVGIEQLARAYAETRGLRVVGADTRERAELLLKWMVNEQRTRSTTRDAVALLLLRGGEVGLIRSGDAVQVPKSAGSGVGIARALLDAHERRKGSDPRLLGKVDSIGEKADLEVWAARVPEAGSSSETDTLVWMTFADAVRAVAQSQQPDFDSVAAISLGFRSGAAPAQETVESPILGDGQREDRALSPDGSVGESLEGWETAGSFLNSEISILEFNTRVLAMAEDLETPLRERFRFLSIVSANIDEFFMVRVAALKQVQLESVEETGSSTLTPQQQLDLIAAHAATLVARQYRCFEACMAEAAGKSVRILQWAELDEATRARLRDEFSDDILPALTPLAMTLSAGHPFPRLAHLSLSLAVVLLDSRGGAPHFAHVELPGHLPRFTTVGKEGTVIATEEIVRANLDLLYPGLGIEQAYLFRVTRGADITLDEDNAWSLLHAVDEASKRRYENPVVRVEVEGEMPSVIRELVLKEMQREHSLPLTSGDIYEVPGFLDLGAVSALTFPADASLEFSRIAPREGFSTDADLWNVIAERDRVFHHPFDSFGSTVSRFFTEAASDPNVTAIKTTLYRAGEKSPIVDALIAAAKSGKDVVAFVELKARFDEERNVGWAKKLQEAGGKMVFGFVGLKTHAKAALVVRREAGKLRRYAHVGTGNYNADTAKRYTDLSLFSADPALTGDIQDLFNELTGSSSQPEPLTRGCLIAPRQLLPALIEKIEREAAHARAGKNALIRMKLNGLSDPDVIEALYRASRDGVKIGLVVRGICTLRPGVPGMSENIAVLSVVGRFLEHSRIYHFVNAGDEEYYIGSPDLRPRNLRRRIELIAPVREPAARSELGHLLDLYLSDSGAWELQPGGEYRRRAGRDPSVQAQLSAPLSSDRRR
ncbi:MAG: polyphosphate kinase 1 [Gemmatimonadota bacterium]|nr:polyphosphate kinase 1 [Gemmatimonadota bacterium]